ncbi:MAG: hypothetical protein GEV28_19150 [Actinophytocola sp.]|uniref:hypothetical protein n=1 Tax=Actinophytocola sp. TaxID=1872138 RepID=UPI0013295F19|nr:hypothetical protein [Actinophytocola sp.]MPZ82396.1 hypothetical protein [Actinophytocola sp.]
MGFVPLDATLSPVPFTAETFLVQDSGTRDENGKDVVNVFGGIKWGWQVQSAWSAEALGKERRSAR